MIVGTGTDIVDIGRIRRILGRYGSRFAGRILTDREQRKFEDPVRLAAYMARQFAAKEAVSKALGTGMRNGVHFRNIEVTRRPSGEPQVTLLAGAEEHALRRGIARIHLTMSDEKDYAIAFAVAEAAGELQA